MKGPRVLPDSCYDFFVVDDRDGEMFGPFDAIDAARKKAKAALDQLPSWQRCVIVVEWKVNERKVLAALARRRRQRG